MFVLEAIPLCGINVFDPYTNICVERFALREFLFYVFSFSCPNPSLF